MPAAIVAVASMAAGAAATGLAVSAGLVVAGGIGAAVIGGVTSLAATALLSSAAGLNKKAQSQSVDQLSKGVLLNTAGTVDPIPVIYGRRRIGGTRVLTESTGSSNEYLHIVIAHCEGPIDAIETVYLDDVATTDSKFSGLVTVEKFLGADDQAACQSLIDALPAKWTSAHRLRGVAYTYVKLKYDSNVFSSLPTITVDIRGRTVYDPRTSTTAWAQNPALCTRDYLTNARYGRGVPADDVDEAMFITAANDCEVTFTAPDSTTHPRHTCNGVIDTDQSSADNMVNLLSCCRGMLIFSARGYGLLIDKAQLPTSFAFTEDNITGGWTFSPGGKRTLYNRVRGNWFNPDNEWQPDIMVADSTTYRTLDNGLMLEAQIELPFTISSYEATILTQRHLRQSRFGMTATFRAFIAGMFCEVGDIVPITHSTPGWAAKPFRITRISLLSSDEVEVEVAEYDDSVYSATPLTTPRISAITNLPDPTDIPAPTNLVVGTSIVTQPDGTHVPRFQATWTAAASVWVVGYDVAWREDGGPWDTAFVTEPVFGLWATAVGRTYDVRVRSVGSLGTKSVWISSSGTQAAPTVGPAAPTASATGGLFSVRLTWAFGDSRKDIRSTEVWFASSNSRAAATRLTAEPFPGTEYTHPGLAPGAGGYYWLRVVDTWGNYSTWYPTSSGLYAVSSTDASNLLTQLQGALGEPQMAAALAARIELIDGPATLDGSVNDRIDSVSSALGSDLAAVETSASASASAITGLKAKWSVKVQTMADGVQALGGIELLSGANGQSSVAVLADKFLIYKPDGTGTPKQMLTLGTVNGVTALGLDGSMIIDGTVVARSIDSRGLAIRDASGNVILGSGTALASSNIAAGLSGNMIPNSDFSAGVSNWAQGYVQNPTGSWSGVILDPGGIDWTPAGGHAVGAVREGGAAAGRYDIYLSTLISVTPSTRYELSAYLAAHRCAVSLCVGYFKYVSGTLTQISETWFTSSGPDGNGGQNLAAWSRTGGFVTTPADATCVRIWVSGGATTSVSPYFWATRLFFARAGANQTQLSEWSAGGNSGAFAECNQITAANVSTFIAAAAIGTAYLTDAAITTAKIADANITSAKIGDAQVNTLKIAGEAVTVPRAATGVQEATTSAIYLDSGQRACVIATGFGATTSRTLTLDEVSTSGRIAQGDTGSGGGITLVEVFTAPYSGWFAFYAHGTGLGVGVMVIGAKR